MSGLPPSWTIKMSKSHNREYFYNTTTKESTWTPPHGTNVEQLQKYLNDEKHTPQEIRASHLLVKHLGSRRPRSWKNENITISKQDAIAILNKYLQQLQNGSVSFAELAQTESDCSSHTNGGDLGNFGKGAMQPSFEKLAFELQVGELSGLVESDSGIHIILRTA